MEKNLLKQIDIDHEMRSSYIDYAMSVIVGRALPDVRDGLKPSQVDKLINLCVLKDHQSAGVTVALKNLSHGLVNNVARSHQNSTLHCTSVFIPAIVDLAPFRQKAVLHIADGVKGVYHGGPAARPPK